MMSNNNINTQSSIAPLVASFAAVANALGMGRLYGRTINSSTLRRGPASSYGSIQNVASGIRLMILGRSNDEAWTQVEIGRNVGWLRSRDLRETRLHGQAESNGSLRSGPSASSPVIHSFRAGIRVMVLSINGSRSFVRIGSRTGWMANSRLALIERHGQTESSGSLRSSSSSSSPVTHSFRSGARVIVFSETGNRSFVRIGSRTGWMANSRLALIDRHGRAESNGTLRSGPSASSPVIHSFTAGTRAMVFGANGNRSLVQMGNRIGWMANSRLALIDRHGRAESNGALRSGPSASFPVIHSFTAGTRAMVFGANGNRSLVQMGNRIGWMANSRLVLINRNGQAESNGALRSGPSASSPVIHSFTRGVRVMVFGINGNRSLVRIGTRIGWMSNSRLSLNKNRRELAQEILNRYGRGRILMPRWAANMTDANRRSAFANIRDTANGRRATTPFGQIDLSADLLRAILRMNDEFGIIQINAIAGGNHVGGANDPHAIGVAADFQSTNHVVNTTGQRPRSILTALENTWRYSTQRTHRNSNYIGDANHFHLEIWGRR